MCKVQMLRALVEQRLTAAAEEIFGLFERTIAEYEEELCRSKEENERQRELLDAVFNPQLRVHRADVQQLLVVKEEVPAEQQEGSSSVDQQEPESPPHIKKEQEKWWSSQQGEHLQGLEEADITKFIFTPVLVKSEDDEEKDMQQLLVVKAEVPPEQQECSSSVDQEEPKPPPHIKEEQEKWWSSQEGEQLQGREEADITKFPFTPVPVKCEDDKEEVQSSQLHQRQTQHMETEPEGEDSGGPEPARNSQPYLQPETEDQTGDSSELDTDDSADWKETREPQSALNSLKHDLTSKKIFSCSECEQGFVRKSNLKTHMRTHTGERPFTCSVCKKHKCVGHTNTEADGKNCERPEPARNSHSLLQTGTEDQTGDSSEPETDDSADWKETREPRSASNSLKHDSRYIKQLLVQQECSSSVDQEQPEAPPHIKEEQTELWSSQEGEQLQGLEEADITKFPFTPVPVKSEDEKEEAQSSQLHQRHTQHMETEADGEDCGGPEPEPARNSNPPLQPETKDQTADSSEPEPENDDNADWKETREPQSALNSLKHDSRCKKTFSCSECGRRFGRKTHLKRHMIIHTGEKPFSCSDCGTRFGRKTHLKRHMIIHTGEKTFSCSECGRRFGRKTQLQTHIRNHTGQKPFSCSICKKSFTVRGCLKQHMIIHTGEKPFRCSECGKRFNHNANLKTHMITHIGEKAFSCSVCKKSFTNSRNLKYHMKLHSGKEPFGCSKCGKRFNCNSNLKRHLITHTGEKPFSCSVCDQRFNHVSNMKTHMRTHTGEKAFSCSVCKKSFTQSGHLKYHMKQHTGKGPSTSCVSDIRKQQRWSSSVTRGSQRILARLKLSEP